MVFNLNNGIQRTLGKLVYGSYDILNDKNKSVLKFDAWYKNEYDNQNAITDMPIEKGTFTTIQKNNTPENFTLTVIKTNDAPFLDVTNIGTPIFGNTFYSSLNNFLKQCRALAQDYNIYTIVTPYQTFKNMNIIGCGWNNVVENGVNLIIVELTCKQVLQASSTITASGITSPKIPQNASTVNNGELRPIEKATAGI